jgi:hypothetical protein
MFCAITHQIKANLWEINLGLSPLYTDGRIFCQMNILDIFIVVSSLPFFSKLPAILAIG